MLQAAMAINSVTSIFSGVLGTKNAKKIAKTQRETAKMQYEYNKREVERAFNDNLKGLMRNYATQKLNATEEAKTMLSTLNINLGKKNVEEESFKKDIKDKTEKEISDNLTFMVADEIAAIDNLGLMKAAQNYQIGLNYESASSVINQQLIKAKRQNAQKILNGMTQGVIQSSSFIMNDGFGEKTVVEESDNNIGFNAYDSDYFSKKISEFNFGGAY